MGIATIATLVVDVVGNTTGLNQSLGRAQGSVASFGKIASPVMIGVGAAIAAVGVASIKAASDLNESLNKAKVVFEGASDSVIQFSETTAESFGISQNAALDAASGFGAMAQSAGLSERASADMSIALVKLAADMASFNNQDPSEMLERLRSGLAGEAEPLRRFGVFISEARVQTEAYAQGIAKAGEELTDAQKVQARFNIIMQDTAKQQGDFARTVGESLPNQMRVLKARLIDLAASLGQILLPAALKVADALNFLLTPLIEAVELIDRLGTFKPPAEQLAATATWAEAVRDLSEAWHAGAITSAAYQERLTALGARFEGDQPILIRQVEHYLALQDSFAQAGKGANGLADDVTKSGDAMKGAESRGRDLAASTNDLADETQRLTEEMRDNRLAVLGLTNNFLGILDQMDAVSEAQQRLNQLERHGKEDTKAYEEAVRDAITAQAGLEEAIFQYAQELLDSGQKASDVKKKIKDLADDFGIQRDVVSELISKVQGYINKLNTVPDRIDTRIFLSFIKQGATPSELHAAGLQHGGIVERTGLAVVHRGEVFSGVNNEMGLGTGITVNVTGWVGNDQELARKIRDELNKLGGRNSGTGLR